MNTNGVFVVPRSVSNSRLMATFRVCLGMVGSELGLFSSPCRISPVEAEEMIQSEDQRNPWIPAVIGHLDAFQRQVGPFPNRSPSRIIAPGRHIRLCTKYFVLEPTVDQKGYDLVHTELRPDQFVEAHCYFMGVRLDRSRTAAAAAV